MENQFHSQHLPDAIRPNLWVWCLPDTIRLERVKRKLFAVVLNQKEHMLRDQAEWAELANTNCKIQSNKADNFFASYCFCCSPSTVGIFETNWTISIGSVVKGNFANDVYNQSEKLKLNLPDFRLILLDHITYFANHYLRLTWFSLR